jgi:endonuclease/exonuclease/phosphatase family metal-dependent hydrolase
MVSVVVTWNVAGRVSSVAAQAAALGEVEADVVALQEVRLTALDAWRAELAELGYADVRTSWDARAADAAPPAPERRLGVVVATRAADDIERVAAPPEVPWPERLLVARVTLAGARAELVNLHAPVSSREDEVKVRTLEAVTAYLERPAGHPRVLVGDLNTPQYESREGEVRSFARTRSGRIRPTHGERHDRAELGIVVGLRDHGYADAFRAVHGYERRDRSWMYHHGRMGYRLDHVLVRGLRVEACDYVHGWRERRLSDHSGMWARLAAP